MSLSMNMPKLHSIARTTLALFETQVLVFPVLVVVLACTSFFFGGTCAAWQWWTAVGLVIALPWFKNEWRTALISDVAFAGILAILWLLAPMNFDGTYNPDYSLYHLPQIRLLTHGWNPVVDPLATDIVARLGLSMDGMSYMHVAFVSKTAAIFSAVAYAFVRDPYALTYPIVFFLFVGVALATFKAFQGSKGILAILFLMMLWYLAPSTLYVDCSMMLSSAGLLLAMYASLQNRRLRVVPLVCFSFWMMNLKLPGLLAAFVFWVAFAGIWLWRNREQWQWHFGRLAGLGAVLVALLAVVSYSPYGTSFRDYGHPLYPFKTADAEKFPARNLTWDLKIGNADYDQMGYWGEFCNAYLSHKLVKAYYNWKLDRNDFKPHKYIWDYSFADTAIDHPLSFKERLCIWAALAILLALPTTRLFGLMMLAMLLLFPRAYMGFMRYQPWIDVFECMAAAEVIRMALGKLRHNYWQVLSICIVALVCVYRFAIGIKHKTVAIYAKSQEITRNVGEVYTCYVPPKSRIPSGYISSAGERSAYGGYMLRRYCNNVILLFRDIDRDAEIKALPAEQAEYVDFTPFGYYIFNMRKADNLRKSSKEKLLTVLNAWTKDYFILLARRN